MGSKRTSITDSRRIYRNMPHRNRKLRILEEDKKISFDEDFLRDVHDEGVDLIEEGKYKQAIRQFDKILNYGIHPNFANDFVGWWDDALYHEAESFSELGWNKLALDSLNYLLQNNPNDIDILLAKGYELDELHRHIEALRCYKTMLKINPKDGDALINMSNSLLQLKKYKDALNTAKKAVKLAPQDDDALYNKGEALFYLGQYYEALKSFQKVIKIDPTDDEVWYMKARCLCHMNKKENEAIDSLLVAIALNPKNRFNAKKEKDFLLMRSIERYKKLVK